MAGSIPLSLVNEAEDLVVSVEMTDGVGYKGRLVSSEENMNMMLEDVVSTSRDGSTSHIDKIFVRGSQVRFISLPDLLEKSPILPGNKQ